jgi:hypothetical protein
MVDSDALVSGPDAAVYFTRRTPSRVSGATIRSWAHRGYKDIDGQRRKLEPVDYEGPRRAARYRWSDLLDAERATRRNPKSPGRARTKELVAA